MSELRRFCASLGLLLAFAASQVGPTILGWLLAGPLCAIAAATVTFFITMALMLAFDVDGWADRIIGRPHP